MIFLFGILKRTKLRYPVCRWSVSCQQKVDVSIDWALIWHKPILKYVSSKKVAVESLGEYFKGERFKRTQDFLFRALVFWLFYVLFVFDIFLKLRVEWFYFNIQLIKCLKFLVVEFRWRALFLVGILGEPCLEWFWKYLNE